MEYEINKHYPIEELPNISEWWQKHQDYDINEYREPRVYNENGEEIKPLNEYGYARAYNDYIEIVKRPEDMILSMLRAKREPLLKAFDKWEKAVLRGREIDDATIGILWYRDLLDLKETAFETIPIRIQYYL